MPCGCDRKTDLQEILLGNLDENVVQNGVGVQLHYRCCWIENYGPVDVKLEDDNVVADGASSVRTASGASRAAMRDEPARRWSGVAYSGYTVFGELASIRRTTRSATVRIGPNQYCDYGMIAASLSTPWGRRASRRRRRGASRGGECDTAPPARHRRVDHASRETRPEGPRRQTQDIGKGRYQRYAFLAGPGSAETEEKPDGTVPFLKKTFEAGLLIFMLSGRYS